MVNGIRVKVRVGVGFIVGLPFKLGEESVTSNLDLGHSF